MLKSLVSTTYLNFMKPSNIFCGASFFNKPLVNCADDLDLQNHFFNTFMKNSCAIFITSFIFIFIYTQYINIWYTLFMKHHVFQIQHFFDDLLSFRKRSFFRITSLFKFTLIHIKFS